MKIAAFAGIAVIAFAMVLLAGRLMTPVPVQVLGSPTPEPHPDVPTNSYRSAYALPVARDTTTGEAGTGTAHPKIIESATGYGWIRPSLFTDRHPATDHQLTMPHCTGMARYLFVTPLPLADLELGGGINQANTTIQVSSYDEDGVAYRVYAFRSRLLCSVMGGIQATVRP